MIGFRIQLRSKRRPLVVQVRSRSMKRENPALRCPPPLCDGCIAGSKISNERKQILSMYLSCSSVFVVRTSGDFHVRAGGKDMEHGDRGTTFKIIN